MPVLEMLLMDDHHNSSVTHKEILENERLFHHWWLLALPVEVCDLLHNSGFPLLFEGLLKRWRFLAKNGVLHFNPKQRWAISATWDGRLLSRPEGKPVIWPSMNRDPTKWPSYDDYSLETSLHPSSPSFLLSLPFHFMVLHWYCPTSYMITVHKECPKKVTVLLMLSRGHECEHFNRMTLKRVLHWYCPTSYMILVS